MSAPPKWSLNKQVALFSRFLLVSSSLLTYAFFVIATPYCFISTKLVIQSAICSETCSEFQYLHTFWVRNQAVQSQSEIKSIPCAKWTSLSWSSKLSGRFTFSSDRLSTWRTFMDKSTSLEILGAPVPTKRSAFDATCHCSGTEIES